MTGRLSVFVAAVSFVGILLTFITLADPAATRPPSSGQAPTTGLPSSLDDLYPPQAQRPVLLLAMHELNAALAGIVVDITEGDREGAMANLEILRDRYRESASLVPEWESWYPLEPVEELAKVVPMGDPGQVMPAVGKLGAVCHKCHLATMVPVQFKYRWPDFASVMVQDPVTGTEIDYPGFMQMLNAGLTGVATNLGQGQPDNARAQLAAFRSRMDGLRESCDTCHDTERSYFVDKQIEALLADMDRALEATVPDPTAVAALSRRIGEESCTRCHLVHLPAAYSQSR